MSQGDLEKNSSPPATEHSLSTADDTPRRCSGASTSATTVILMDGSGAMDLVLSELQQSITEAENYRKREQQYAPHLRSHIAALQEDCDMVTTVEAPDAETRTQATKMLFQARRLKRHLERDAIDLEVKQGKQDQVVKEKASTTEKETVVKLAPLKLPEFNGEAAQFLVFKNFFEENILHSAKITDTTKWLRLRECLTGPPAELIQELPQTSHSLAIAWQLLNDVYGGDERPVVDLYDRLQRLPTAANATASLRVTHSKLEGILLSLEHLGHDIENNQFVRWIVLSKYPPEVMYFVPQTKSASLAELRAKIADIISIRETADFHRASTTVADKSRPPSVKPQVPKAVAAIAEPSAKSYTARTTPSQPRSCVFCSAEHWNDQCTVYATISARKARIQGRCLKCLRAVHAETPCIGRVRCFHCDSLEHNRALCPKKFPADAAKVTTLATTVHGEGAAPSAKKTGCFLTFVAAVSVQRAEKSIPVRIVVDTAGGESLICRKAAERLNLKCQKTEKVTYAGLDGVVMTESSQVAEPIHLHASNGETVQVQAAVVETIAQDVPVPDLERFRRENPQFSDKYIPPTGEDQPIDILIGSDVIVDVLLPDKIIYVNANMLLMPTKFGWLLLARKKEQKVQVCHTTILLLNNNPIKLMTSLDLIGLQELHDSAIEEEQRAIKHFYSTVKFVDNRYSISWPWKTKPPLLDSNYGLALGRLRSLYKRLKNTPHLLQEYHQIIEKQLQDGIIERVDSQKSASHCVHYLPHHPVLQPEKSTTIRPVYDGAAKANPGKLSLNDNILKGTKWLNDLAATLMRFRKYRTVATADIAKAFHQIAINEPDRDAVRFVWLKNPCEMPIESNLQTYRFTRVAFGIIASPFILHATISYHATQQKSNEFTDIILKNLYADNLVVALEPAVDVKEFYRYAKQFFEGMSMNLTKWTTNDEQLRQHIPSSDRIDEAKQNVLGLTWSIEEDTLSIKPAKFPVSKKITRRTIAKEIAQNFDPMGWAVPILHTAKVFFRKAWENTEKWDEELQETETEEWLQTRERLNEIRKIKLPRLIVPEQPDKVQIHTFVDASKQAYAVVSYLRISVGDKVWLSLVAAKNRLTPKKQVSIPKLEFVAAVLGCRFTDFVKKSLDFKQQVETYVWTDSKCVVAWMTQKRILPPIIQNYVQKAKEYGVQHIRHVPSEKNYADVATRGANWQDLQEMNWWRGPDWLHREEDWPSVQHTAETETDNILVFCKQLTTKREIIEEHAAEGVATLRIRDFSKLTRLLRTTTNVLNAVQKICNKALPHWGKQANLRTAQMKWLLWDQNRQYRLQGEADAGRTFKLKNILVFRDELGLIRCQTRMQNSGMAVETINPVLLVKKSTLTKLIILHEHEKQYHAGTSHTLASLRRQFWLPQGRREVYWTIHNECYRCRRYTAQSYPVPPPAPLPEFRIKRTQKPFQIIGMDIFGPIWTRAAPGGGQPKQKIWGLLFTCAIIRAIHIEMLEESTTEEISLAFRRFVARRGVPLQIVSDNAPMFHLLDGCFANLWKTVAKAPAISAYFQEHKIEWKFITEEAPWMGGFYERLVGAVKIALEKTYGNKILLKKQLQTTLVEIEAIVNARPIAYVDKELESPILTPSDFLTATYVAIPMETAAQPKDQHFIQLWKSSQQHLEEFWKTWSAHYLLMLRERHDKLKQPTKSAVRGPEKGDVVVMTDVNKKRSHWQLAVVERSVKSDDGIVRTVQIRIKGGVRLLRSVTTLAPLNIIMDLPKVSDQQLNRRRDGILVWPLEGASQENVEGGEERRDCEREARSGGSGAVPYHSNGSENELGAATAEPAPCGTSSEAATSPTARECRGEPRDCSDDG